MAKIGVSEPESSNILALRSPRVMHPEDNMSVGFRLHCSLLLSVLDHAQVLSIPLPFAACPVASILDLHLALHQ